MENALLHGQYCIFQFNEDHQRSHDEDRKSTRLNSSHGYISYAVFCLKKKKNKILFVTHYVCFLEFDAAENEGHFVVRSPQLLMFKLDEVWQSITVTEHKTMLHAGFATDTRSCIERASLKQGFLWLYFLHASLGVRDRN